MPDLVQVSVPRGGSHRGVIMVDVTEGEVADAVAAVKAAAATALQTFCDERADPSLGRWREPRRVITLENYGVDWIIRGPQGEALTDRLVRRAARYGWVLRADFLTLGEERAVAWARFAVSPEGEGPGAAA